MSLTVPPSSVAVVLDPGDDAIHTHTALVAHHPLSGRVTLHPGPGTTSETSLAHDLLAALGKPPLLPGRFPAGRQPAWEAAAAWMTALPVTRLTVLRAHRLTARRTMRLLQLRALTGIHLTLVCHRPHLPAALHQALRTVDYSVTDDFQAARRHYYGSPVASPVASPSPSDEPARPADRWLTLPALDRLVSYDSPRPCADPCTPPPIIWRHRPPPVPLTAHTAQRVARRLSSAQPDHGDDRVPGRARHDLHHHTTGGGGVGVAGLRERPPGLETRCGPTTEASAVVSLCDSATRPSGSQAPSDAAPCR